MLAKRGLLAKELYIKECGTLAKRGLLAKRGFVIHKGNIHCLYFSPHDYT